MSDADLLSKQREETRVQNKGRVSCSMSLILSGSAAQSDGQNSEDSGMKGLGLFKIFLFFISEPTAACETALTEGCSAEAGHVLGTSTQGLCLLWICSAQTTCSEYSAGISTHTARGEITI